MPLLDEVAAWLIAGDVASSSGSGVGWYLYRGSMPDSTAIPDRAVAIIETGGLAQIPNVDVGQPTFQVIVRGASVLQVSTAYEEARRRAQLVRDRLHFVIGEVLSGVRYPSIQAAQEPFFTGDDLRQRPLFACNYRALRELT